MRLRTPTLPRRRRRIAVDDYRREVGRLRATMRAITVVEREERLKLEHRLDELERQAEDTVLCTPRERPAGAALIDGRPARV